MPGTYDRERNRTRKAVKCWMFRYRDGITRHKEILEEIEDLRQRSMTINAYNFDKQTDQVKGYYKSKTESFIVRIEKKQDLLFDCIEKTFEARQEIEDIIKAFEGEYPVEAIILYSRYIVGLKWDDAALSIGLTNGMIHQKHREILDQIILKFGAEKFF